MLWHENDMKITFQVHKLHFVGTHLRPSLCIHSYLFSYYKIEWNNWGSLRKSKIFSFWFFTGSLPSHDLAHYFPNQKVHSSTLCITVLDVSLFPFHTNVLQTSHLMIPCQAVNFHFWASHPIGEIVEGIPWVGLKAVAKVGCPGEKRKYCIWIRWTCPHRSPPTHTHTKSLSHKILRP